MNLFNDKDGKFKRLEKIILDIEKEKHTLAGLTQQYKVAFGILEESKPNKI